MCIWLLYIYIYTRIYAYWWGVLKVVLEVVIPYDSKEKVCGVVALSSWRPGVMRRMLAWMLWNDQICPILNVICSVRDHKSGLSANAIVTSSSRPVSSIRSLHTHIPTKFAHSQKHTHARMKCFWFDYYTRADWRVRLNQCVCLWAVSGDYSESLFGVPEYNLHQVYGLAAKWVMCVCVCVNVNSSNYDCCRYMCTIPKVEIPQIRNMFHLLKSVRPPFEPEIVCVWATANIYVHFTSVGRRTVWCCWSTYRSEWSEKAAQNRHVRQLYMYRTIWLRSGPKIMGLFRSPFAELPVAVAHLPPRICICAIIIWPPASPRRLQKMWNEDWRRIRTANIRWFGVVCVWLNVFVFGVVGACYIHI